LTLPLGSLSGEGRDPGISGTGKVGLMRYFLICLIMFSLISSCTESESPIGSVEKARPPAPSGVTPIGKIIERPGEFTGKKVTLRGEVEPGLAFEFVNEQPYLLKDTTGQIWVITSSVMPPKGSPVTIEGEVVSPYQIKGRRFEIAVIERKRG